MWRNNNLSIVIFVLFLLCLVGTFGYMARPLFWYESFQNWQSEFLAVLAIVVLSIWLRQWGSPESKPVHAAHTETGSG